MCSKICFIATTLLIWHAAKSPCNALEPSSCIPTNGVVNRPSLAETDSTVEKKSILTEGNVEIIDLDPTSFAPNSGFYESWEKSFPVDSSPLFNYSARDDPERTLLAVHDAYDFVVKLLPRSVLARLASFPFQKSGPSAILIRGIPIDAVIPPTPTKSSVFEDSAGRELDQSTLAPIAESWLLGVSRVLGIPIAAPLSTGNRGGLVRDITQVLDDDGDLPMHRDYPTIALDPTFGVVEPEIFILFGVRGDIGDNGAKTVVMDSAKLLLAIDPADEALLRATTIQTEFKLPTGKYIPMGRPFHAIQDNEDGTAIVTLNNLQNARYHSPDGGEATVEAYDRISQLAFDMGERVDLQPGDMLIIQNSRLVHGRTKFHSAESCCDGSGRWLVKSYVSNSLWGIPGSSRGGHTDFPNLNPSPWRDPNSFS